MHKKYLVTLTEKERTELISLIKTGKASAKKLTHARIVLATDESDSAAKKKTDSEIGKELHVSAKTVSRIRQQFVVEGLESCLLRRLHSNFRPRKIDGEQEAHLVALTCSDPPEGRARWTLKLLANQLVELEVIDEISSSTVGRTLKKTK